MAKPGELTPKDDALDSRNMGEGNQVMKCEICGRQYINLGVHLRHKHHVDPDDYREEHGMLLATPLVDKWLSERMKENQIARLKDPEYKTELTLKCLENSKNKIGKPNKREMTQAGKGVISRLDKERNEKYLCEQSVVVARVLREKGTMFDVRKITGSGPEAAKKMAKIAGIDYSRESAKIVRDKRAAATMRSKAMIRVALVLPLLETTRSAAEMCRQAGISTRTYKNWLKAGLITRHPNGRGPKS